MKKDSPLKFFGNMSFMPNSLANKNNPFNTFNPNKFSNGLFNYSFSDPLNDWTHSLNIKRNQINTSPVKPQVKTSAPPSPISPEIAAGINTMRENQINSLRNVGSLRQNTYAPIFQQSKNSMQYNTMNEKALSNLDNIKKINGETIPNTFTRKVTPLNQLDDYVNTENMDLPVNPPNNVQTPIVPPYDINNY